MPEFLFLKSCRPEGCNFIKKRLWHRCFPVNFMKFLRKPFFTEHLWWLPLPLVINKNEILCEWHTRLKSKIKSPDFVPHMVNLISYYKPGLLKKMKTHKSKHTKETETKELTRTVNNNNNINKSRKRKTTATIKTIIFKQIIISHIFNQESKHAFS